MTSGKRDFSLEQPGAQIGIYTVKKFSGKNSAGRVLLDVICSVCGFEQTLTKGNMLCAAARGSKYCLHCSALAGKRAGAKSDHRRRISTKAKKRGLEYTVTAEYLDHLMVSQDYKCALTGVDIECKARRSTASLDRIDSTKGYVEGNVQWVHRQVNVAKHILDNEGFFSLCLTVVLHRVSNMTESDKKSILKHITGVDTPTTDP